MKQWEKDIKRSELIKEISEIEKEMADVKAFIHHFEEIPLIAKDGYEEMEKLQKKLKLLRTFLKRYRKRVFIDYRGRYFRG